MSLDQKNQVDFTSPSSSSLSFVGSGLASLPVEDRDDDDDDQGRLHGGSAQGGDCSRGLSRHWDWKSQIRKHIRRSSPLT